MAANTSNTTTCPAPTSIPDLQTLPIPQNINLMATPGNDTSYRPMEICCSPSTVQIVDRCYLWCELPERYFNGTDKQGAQSASSSCMGFNTMNSSEGRIVGWQMNGGSRPGMPGSAKKIGLWVLVLSGLICVV